MCGFVCVVNRSLSKNNEEISINKKLLNHRGPDFSKQINHKNVSFRHWRLSIIDLTEYSNQPIINRDDIFLYNGELYDYKEVGSNYKIQEKGDTHTFFSILKQKNGLEVLQNQQGFFSFLLYNKSLNTLRGGRDRFGKKPLYYFLGQDVAIFSSEEKGIFPFLKNIEINSNSIMEYFLYKTIFHGKTFFKNINEIPPGSSFKFDIKNWDFQVSLNWSDYYSLNLKESFFRNNSDNLLLKSTNVGEMLSEAVNRRIKCDVPVQIALSGGIDSTAISALAKTSKFHYNILRSITLGFDVGIDESKLAMDISEKLNLENCNIKFNSNRFLSLLETTIEKMESPLDHPHAIGYYLITKEARKKGKVLITGEGADELFFGYNHYNNFGNESFAFREYLKPEDEKVFKGKIFDFIRKQTAIEHYREFALQSPQNSRDLELKTHLISLLKRNDKMSMANSIEIRAPFLDQKIVSYAFNCNQEEIIKTRKNFISDVAFSLIPDLPKFGKKNGFRIPFDENFNKIKGSEKGNYYIELGLDQIKNITGMNYNMSGLNPRIGWSIMNIGCFLNILKDRRA